MMNRLSLMLIGLAMSASPAFAQNDAGSATASAAPITGVTLADSGDTAWVLAAALVVLLATLCGVILRFGGLVRARNSVSVAVQALLIVALLSVVWIVIGYSLAFDVGTPDTVSGSAWLGGARNVLLANLGELRQDLTIPESGFALFQLVAALIAPLLLIGAWAERVRLSWMIAFIPLWFLVGYVPLAHWLWADGWLASTGASDSGGGLVIQTLAGVSALAIALILKGRNNRAAPVTAAAMPGLALLGSIMLVAAQLALFGGLAFEANDAAAAALINGLAAASAGVVAATLIAMLRRGAVTSVGVARGALSGLAAVAAGVSYVAPGGALLLGLIGGTASTLVARQLATRFSVDDPGEVFAIHGVGGILGALAYPIFVGTAFGGGGLDTGTSLGGLLGAQAFAVLMTIVWAAFVSIVLGYGLTLVVPIRATAEDEAQGLDAATHHEKGWTFD